MGLRIFIVEDDPAYSKMLEYRLNQAGFTNLTVFENGEDCLSNLDKKPGLILLDFSLQGLNGLDTLLHIKKVTPKTTVIVLTALDNDKLAKECIEAGASDYLAKEEGSIKNIVERSTQLQKNLNSNRRMRTVMLIIIAMILAAVIYFTGLVSF